MERRRSIWGGESYRCAHRTCTGAVLIRPWHGERDDGAALSSSVASRRLVCIARAAFSELHRQSREVNSCALSPRSSHGICLSCPPWNFASSDPLPPLLGRDLLLRGRAGAGVRPRFPSIGDRYWRYLVLLQLEYRLIVLWYTNPATSIAERICRAPTRPGGRSRRSGPP